MPQPPQLDELTELSFITNYFIQGCEPPYWLLLKFSREPIHDLALLFLELNAFDIGQSIFGPKGSRKRTAARHGRKSRRFRGMPDPNDLVGDKIRTKIAPNEQFNWGPYRRAFKLLNLYERFNFSLAVVGGLTDVGFETLYGVLTFDELHCPGMAYLHRRYDGGLTKIGVSSPFAAYNLATLEGLQQFYSQDGFGWRTDAGDYTVGASGRVYATSDNDVVGFKLTIRGQGGELYGESSAVDIPRGQSVQLSVEAEVPVGVHTALCRDVEFGTTILYGPEAFAFVGTWF